MIGAIRRGRMPAPLLFVFHLIRPSVRRGFAEASGELRPCRCLRQKKAGRNFRSRATHGPSECRPVSSNRGKADCLPAGMPVILSERSESKNLMGSFAALRMTEALRLRAVRYNAGIRGRGKPRPSVFPVPLNSHFSFDSIPPPLRGTPLDPKGGGALRKCGAGVGCGGTIPQSASPTAPFTQGGRVHRRGCAGQSPLHKGGEGARWKCGACFTRRVDRGRQLQT